MTRRPLKGCTVAILAQGTKWAEDVRTLALYFWGCSILARCTNIHLGTKSLFFNRVLLGMSAGGSLRPGADNTDRRFDFDGKGCIGFPAGARCSLYLNNRRIIEIISRTDFKDCRFDFGSAAPGKKQISIGRRFLQYSQVYEHHRIFLQIPR